MNIITKPEEFQNIISESGTEIRYLVVDFFAPWCGPCKVMAPVFEKVAKNYEGNSNLEFVKVDRDEASELISDFGFDVPTIPRFFVVRIENGSHTVVEDIGGAQSKSSLITKINQYVESNSESNITQDDVAINYDPASKTSSHPRIAVIGSGPSGLTAALYASRANLDVTVFAGSQVGGQLTTTTEIENFPGAWSNTTKAGVQGVDLMMTIQQQAEHFGAKVLDSVVDKLSWNLDNNKTTFVLDYENLRQSFDSIIIASGASSKYLGVEDESRWIGKGYHTCATCDGSFYKDRVVAIVGGGDSAMEEANFLTKFASKVYLINRTEKFRASKVMLDRCKNNPKIEFVLNSKVDSFLIENDKFRGVLLNQLDTKIELRVDGLFVAIGHIPNSNFASGVLAQDETGYLIKCNYGEYPTQAIKQGSTLPLEGLFLAGDVQDTKYRQAITAAADGCKAAMDCEKWLEAR